MMLPLNGATKCQASGLPARGWEGRAQAVVSPHEGVVDAVQEHELVVLGHLFLQAEAGIRDYPVTGVQTCALPISIDCGVGEDRAVVDTIDIVSNCETVD